MSSQLTVIIAGIVLVVAIVVALVIMRRGDSRFTYDTQHGTAPRATEGEGNTAATAFKGRFSILTTGVGAMFAALAVKLWGMQMVSSDYYEKQANSNQTRTVTTPAVRGRILDRNGVALVQNRPSLAVVATGVDDHVLMMFYAAHGNEAYRHSRRSGSSWAQCTDRMPQMPPCRAGPRVEAARSVLRQVDSDEAGHGRTAPEVQLRPPRGEDRCHGRNP